MVLTAPPRKEDGIADAQAYDSGLSSRATDWNVGSIKRTILEILMDRQEALDVAAWAALNEAIDEAPFSAWGFTRRAAVAATGQVLFTAAVGAAATITIPAGTRVRVPGSTFQVYQTTAQVTINAPGSSIATAPVICVNAGSQGNVAAGQISEMVPPLPGVAQVTNLSPLITGQDIASDAERRAAFASYIQALPRGTVAALTYGAKTTQLVDPATGLVTEQVTRAKVFETFSSGTLTNVLPANSDTLATVTIGAGLVQVFVANGQGNATTSQALAQLCQQVINGYTDSAGVVHDGWKAAGVATTVYRALEVPLRVNVVGSILPGYQGVQVAALVQAAVTAYFQSLDVGQPMYLSQLQGAIKSVPGIQDITTFQVFQAAALLTSPGYNGGAAPHILPTLTAFLGPNVASDGSHSAAVFS